MKPDAPPFQGGGRRLKEKESQQMIKTACFLEAEQSQSWVTAAYANTPM